MIYYTGIGASEFGIMSSDDFMTIVKCHFTSARNEIIHILQNPNRVVGMDSHGNDIHSIDVLSQACLYDIDSLHWWVVVLGASVVD